MKEKVTRIKEERANLCFEREQLLQTVQKLEFRLKQAQVILNLGEQENNGSAGGYSKSQTRSIVRDNKEDENRSTHKLTRSNRSHYSPKSNTKLTPNVFRTAYN